MKFFVDMPLSPRLAGWLNGLGHDSVHAGDAGLDRSSDQEILDRSRNDDRIIVTADLDYPRLLALMRKPFPGLILFRRGEFSQEESISLLKKTMAIIPPDEFRNTIIVIERTRIRRRRLAFEESKD